MSIISVNYSNVMQTMNQAQNNISNGVAQAHTLLQRARADIGRLGGLSNQEALEGLNQFENSANVLVDAVNHFISAVTGSAQHLQTEEGIIAQSYNLQ